MKLQASLERLQEFAPATAATLRNICAPGQMQDSDFEALLASEGCPASTTRREYAGRQVWHHLVGAVRWQFAAFAEVGRLGVRVPVQMSARWGVDDATLLQASSAACQPSVTLLGSRAPCKLAKCCVAAQEEGGITCDPSQGRLPAWAFVMPVAPWAARLAWASHLLRPSPSAVS